MDDEKFKASGFLSALLLMFIIGFLSGGGYGKRFAADKIKKELSEMGGGML